MITSATVDPAWEQALETLEHRLAQLEPDRCADVRLVLRFNGFRAMFEATTADGVRASRTVRSPGMLVPVALGLLATAPVESSAAQSSRDVSSPSLALPAVDRDRDSPRATSPPPSLTEVDLGLALGSRIVSSSSTILPEIAGRADAVVHHWIVFVGARYGSSVAILGDHPTGYGYSEAALSVGLGRRFAVAENWLDIGLAPTIVGISQESEEPYGGEGPEGSATQIRIACGLRYLLRVSEHWGLVVTADADFAPTALTKTRRLQPSLPALPLWSSALQLGASGELL